MSGSKHIESMQRRTSFFSHHPRVSGSCCANSWDRFTAQKMRYPLPASVRNTKKLARNLRNLIKWTFSSTWAALSSIIASCNQENQKEKKEKYLSYKSVINSGINFASIRIWTIKINYIWNSTNQWTLPASENKWERGASLTESDWSNRRVFIQNSLPVQFFFNPYLRLCILILERGV